MAIGKTEGMNRSWQMPISTVSRVRQDDTAPAASTIYDKGRSTHKPYAAKTVSGMISPSCRRVVARSGVTGKTGKIIPDTVSALLPIRKALPVDLQLAQDPLERGTREAAGRGGLGDVAARSLQRSLYELALEALHAVLLG